MVFLIPHRCNLVEQMLNLVFHIRHFHQLSPSYYRYSKIVTDLSKHWLSQSSLPLLSNMLFLTACMRPLQQFGLGATALRWHIWQTYCNMFCTYLCSLIPPLQGWITSMTLLTLARVARLLAASDTKSQCASSNTRCAAFLIPISRYLVVIDKTKQ